MYIHIFKMKNKYIYIYIYVYICIYIHIYLYIYIYVFYNECLPVCIFCCVIDYCLFRRSSGSAKPYSKLLAWLCVPYLALWVWSELLQCSMLTSQYLCIQPPALCKAQVHDNKFLMQIYVFSSKYSLVPTMCLSMHTT